MQYDLVFEGGGAKGMVFVGAMQEFERRNHTYGRLLGTSAGAITAGLLAAGYDSAEMLVAMDEKTVDKRSIFETFMGEPTAFSADEIKRSVLSVFLDEKNIPLLGARAEARVEEWLLNSLLNSRRYRHVFSFVERGGWYSAAAFIEWMTAKLNSGNFNGKPRNFGGMTLSEMYAVTQTDASFVAANTYAGRILVLNHRTAPDCPVVWAVRMSMSIPFLWQEVEWQSDWGLYRGRDITGHTIVDGAVLSNFPIELLISNQTHVQDVMGKKVSARVIGLLIDDMTLVDGLVVKEKDPAEESGIEFSELRTAKRLMRLLDTMTGGHDKMVLDTMKDMVVKLPAGGYGLTEFDMSEEKRQLLVESGRAAMKKYLDNRPMTLSGSISLGGQDRDKLNDRVDTVVNRILD